MKKIDAFIITSETIREVSATARSKDTASAYIVVKSFDEARDLLDDAKAAALEAMDKWEPAPEPKPVPIDEEEERREKQRAMRFRRGVEQAHEFTSKYDKSGGFRISEIKFLMSENRFDTISDVYALAYRRGYNAALRAAERSNQ